MAQKAANAANATRFFVPFVPIGGIGGGVVVVVGDITGLWAALALMVSGCHR